MKTKCIIDNKVTITSKSWIYEHFKKYIDINGCVIREQLLYKIEILKDENT